MKDNKKNHADTRTSAHTSAQEQRRKLYVLIACDESQAECFAFRELGHVAYSCDIQPCRKGGNPYWHIKGDVSPLLQGDTAFNTQAGFLRTVPWWDLIIAHPPCTYLTRMNALWMRRNANDWVIVDDNEYYVNYNRYLKMCDAREFFYKCLNADAPYVAVENPIPMGIAQLPKPSTFIEPFWFGVKYSKKTLYWLKNLPPIMPTIINPQFKCYVRSSSGKYRSRTFPEVAKAIAKQWSEYILQDITNGNH